ncbi:MAG: SDR family oxidoreductase [Pirellulales bacterium]
MRTFLVTGGAGFIGSHLATALVERGDHVRVLDNFSTGHRHNLEHLDDRVEVIEGDVLETHVVGHAIEGVDCIYHQAALASVPRSVASPLDTNAACVTGTLNVLDAARRGGVRRVVYAGSSSAYGDQQGRAKCETDLPAPLSPYAAAKLAGEHYCHAFTRTYGLETVVIRYFNVFGPRQDPASQYSAVIPLFVTAMLGGQRPTIFGDGKQSRDFTYVANVVHGNLLAADAEAAVGEAINVACGDEIDLLQLVSAVNRVLGTHIEPVHAEPRPGDVLHSRADISRARQLIGYEPQIDFDEGLLRSIEFYRTLANRD